MRVRIIIRTGRKREATGAASTFLSLFPSSFKPDSADEARALERLMGRQPSPPVAQTTVDWDQPTVILPEEPPVDLRQESLFTSPLPAAGVEDERSWIAPELPAPVEKEEEPARPRRSSASSRSPEYG